MSDLSEYLTRYHGKKTVILIDEYDTPIHSSYMNGFYNDMINFMRNFLCSALKDNNCLEKAVLTGILRVAKESIFSGLNNLNVSTIIDNKYSTYFGLLEEDVENIINYYEIESEISNVKEWYNGYVFGKSTIYNPWSILNYAEKWENGFEPHWINTSSNDIVKNLITRGGATLKQELEILIKGECVEKEILQDIVMKDIGNSSNTVWSFLLFSGYLKTVEKKIDKEGLIICKLKIPNLEVRYLYKQIITGWFNESIYNENLDLMLKSLTNGDIETFGRYI